MSAHDTPRVSRGNKRPGLSSIWAHCKVITDGSGAEGQRQKGRKAMLDAKQEVVRETVKLAFILGLLLGGALLAAGTPMLRCRV